MESASSQIAWYKLVDLIARDEKEKALNFYRLFSRSLNDKSYTLQVEADLLSVFGHHDESIIKYQQAALLYKKENKFIQIAALYCHLVTLEPDNQDHIVKLLETYVILDMPDKYEQSWSILLSLYNNKKLHVKGLEKIVKSLMQIIKTDTSSLITRQWFLALIKKYDEKLAMTDLIELI